MKVRFDEIPIREIQRWWTNYAADHSIPFTEIIPHTVREASRDRLTAASLARLTAPDMDAETFPRHASFALDALPALTARADQIKRLRQTILNLAVCGKLVEQDPSDEPVFEYLLGLPDLSAKTQKLLKPLEPSECDGEVPSSWAWLPLGAIIRSMIQMNISQNKLLVVPIPLPPLAEQHRIVERVDALVALCDRLEAALSDGDITRTRLLRALLHEAVAPTLSEMEAAE